MKSIPKKLFKPKIHDIWFKQWFLLTSGDFEKGHFNTMTVAWGYFGCMWNKPVAVVVVRPSRFTYEFINGYDTFTLCAFPDEYKDDLNLLGTESGRDGDKIAKTKLNVIASQKVAAPCFQEAELILECRKIYWDDFKPTHFLDDTIATNYPDGDYHRFFFGEVLEIRGVEKYLER